LYRYIEAVTNFDLSEYADVLAEHHAASRHGWHFSPQIWSM
jgi:hypothetical protein